MSFQVEIRADVAVVKDLQLLDRFFTTTLVRVMHYLKLRCDLSLARTFLDFITGTEDFSSCDNFDKLMRLLYRDYIDIFNISILRELVACFQESELMELVKNYERKKDDFLKQPTVLCFLRAVFSRVAPFIPKGRAVTTIKIPLKVFIRTLNNIKKLAMYAFDDCHKPFVRLHAEASSIIVSRVFPETLSSKLEQKNADIFEEAGVEKVTVGRRREYPVTQQEVRTLTFTFTQLYW